jgi:hypothetical protein
MVQDEQSDSVTILPPGTAITYRIPLESLVCPLSQRKPDGIRPVLAYAFMDGIKAVSNVIPLKGQEKIVWQPTLSRLTGASPTSLSPVSPAPPQVGQ